MAGMRVKATVVGNTLVLEDGVTLPKESTAVDIVMLDADTETLLRDQDVQLPDGARVEAELRLVENGEGVVVDDETAAELEQAHKEADAGDFVTEEEVWADIEARYGK